MGKSDWEFPTGGGEKSNQLSQGGLSRHTSSAHVGRDVNSAAVQQQLTRPDGCRRGSVRVGGYWTRGISPPPSPLSGHVTPIGRQLPRRDYSSLYISGDLYARGWGGGGGGFACSFILPPVKLFPRIQISSFLGPGPVPGSFFIIRFFFYLGQLFSIITKEFFQGTISKVVEDFQLFYGLRQFS